VGRERPFVEDVIGGCEWDCNGEAPAGVLYRRPPALVRLGRRKSPIPVGAASKLHGEGHHRRGRFGWRRGGPKEFVS
jgi:hypothetical protein